MLVHRPKLRRTRSSGRVRAGVRPCGALQFWMLLGQWMVGGRRTSSSTPAMLLLLSQAWFPLRISFLYFVCVLCTLYVVPWCLIYVEKFKKKINTILCNKKN